MKLSPLLISAAAIFALSSAPALASGGGGGGGGGGGSAPSTSAPSFDPVEEYQQGIQKLEAGDYRGAERHFRKVIRVASRDANTHYLLGLSRIGLEKWKKAANDFKKALRYDSELHEARARYGYAAFQRDDMETAHAQLAELQTRQDACAGTCADNARIDTALTSLQAVLAPATESDGETADEASLVLPGPQIVTADAGDAAYLDAVRLINLGRYDEAITELKYAQTAFGPHPDVLTYLGFANRKQGNYAQAISYYSSALDVAPDHLNATEYLGEYYVELGDIDAAEAQLDKLESLCTFGCVQLDELQHWIDAAGT